MYTVIWKYTVLDKNRTDFEIAYRGGGTWAGFFSKDSAYKGSHLLRGTEKENEYVLMDNWDSHEAYDKFLNENDSMYHEMSARLGKLYINEERIGGFYLQE